MSKVTEIVGTLMNVRVALTDPDSNDAPYDPETVSIRMRSPGSESVTYVYGTDAEVVKESTGAYLFRLPLLVEGSYRWNWTGSSAQKAIVIAGHCDAEDGVE